jgi:hypothetical protein
MPSYPPRSLAPVKQLETLAKCEARLRHALASAESDQKVTNAVDRVRQAQLSVLKARRELIRYRPTSDELTRELENIAADEDRWTALPDGELAKQYGPGT